MTSPDQIEFPPVDFSLPRPMNTYSFSQRVIISPQGGGQWRGCVVRHNVPAETVSIRVTNGPTDKVGSIIDVNVRNLTPCDLTLAGWLCNI